MASDANLRLEIAHVLFIDVVGYSKLLTDDQSEALATLNQIVRNTEAVRAAESAGQLVILPTGDGMALVFTRSVEVPVECALQISQALRAHSNLPVRMGIHTGPVHHTEDVNGRPNIAGAGINLAQRVMDLGDAGHILLSKRAAEDLAQYRLWEPHLHQLGEFEVKHGAKVSIVNLYTGQLGNSQLPEKLKQFSRKQATARRVKRTAIVALLFLAIALPAGAFLFFRWMPPAFSRGQGSIPEKSIAVLPFENAGGNPDTEYLSDGIPDALINSLTELQQVKVIARTTAAHYRGKDIDPREIGRQLNVRAVLMGTVRENDKMLNVQVDLVDTLTGAQLWGQQYDRQLSDLISVKQTIVREVTEKLRWRLSGEQQQQLVRHDTTNAEAYQSYLRGRYYWNKRTGEALNKAIEEFQHAIDRDPGYALAYGGLADSYLLLEQYAGVPARESLPKARAAIDRALQIDDSLAEAHTSSALTYYASWRWAEAEKEFGRAIALNPNYPTAHHWFAYYLYVRGRFNEAMREITSAHQLDPLSPVIGENIALGFLFKNDLTAAVEQCQKVIALDRSFADVHHILGYAYLKQQRIDDATGEFQKAVDLSGRAGRYLSELGYCYAVTGKQTQAFPILDELKQKYANRQATGQFVAGVYAGLGDNDQAFAWLEKDFQQRSGQLPTTTWRFEFEQLRKDSRFRDLVGRMGLEP